MNEKRKQFDRDGFIVFESVVESDLIERLIEMTDEVLEKQSPGHFADHVSTGSMVLIDWAMALDYPVMAEFISHPNILAALGYLGFPDPRFGHGRIITKPPGSPPCSGTRTVASGTIRSAIRRSRFRLFSCSTSSTRHRRMDVCG